MEKSFIGRDVTSCENCKKSTLPCQNFKRCGSYCKGWGNALMNEDLCGLCAGRFRDWVQAPVTPIAKKFLKWAFCGWCFQDCRMVLYRQYHAMLLARDVYSCQLCSRKCVSCRNSASSNCRGFAREHDSHSKVSNSSPFLPKALLLWQTSHISIRRRIMLQVCGSSSKFYPTISMHFAR